MTSATLEGRSFRDVTPERGGDVGGDTVFEYHQNDDGTVWAQYFGGTIKLGFLVGTRRNETLDCRYTHLTDRGETASGYCSSRIEVLVDGRLRLHESWRWESKPGGGTSVVEEIS